MLLAHETAAGTRTKDIKTSQGVTFGSMLLAPETLKGLQNSGFFVPSPIQLHAIPLGKCGFDLILEAKSGTGKTAVFSIVALEKLDLQKGLQTIVLAPTREIAAQVCDVVKQIGCCYEGLHVEVVMGGLPVQDDITKLKKKVHILVGSPGRLRQLVQEKYVSVTSVRLLILDEADRLVEKNFVADINFIFSSLPQDKQVIMSSATYPKKAKEAISKYLQAAQHICPHTDSILLGIEQRITLVKRNVNIVKQTKFRFEELLKILSKKPFKQCLIFCNYQTRVAEVGKMLKKAKWPAEQLYGQQNQTDRLEALKTLQDYGCRILVSTDLAARGIDATNVNLVINFEPPFEWQTYLHRIGRAGRFGSYGIAVTILSEGQEENKFKTMLGEIKGSINLKEFWDDKTIVTDINSNMANSTQPETGPRETLHDKEQIFQKPELDPPVTINDKVQIVQKPELDPPDTVSNKEQIVQKPELNTPETINDKEQILQKPELNPPETINDKEQIFQKPELNPPVTINDKEQIVQKPELDPPETISDKEQIVQKPESNTPETKNDKKQIFEKLELNPAETINDKKQIFQRPVLNPPETISDKEQIVQKPESNTTETKNDKEQILKKLELNPPETINEKKQIFQRSVLNPPETISDKEQIVQKPESNTRETKNDKEQIFQKLWDTLADPKEIEIFETLCSFNKKENGIKPFSDLLSSFNTYEPNNNLNEESTYECLSEPDIPTIDYSNIINNMHTKTHMSVKDIIEEEEYQREKRQADYNAFDKNNEMLNAKFKELNILSKSVWVTSENKIERVDNLENGDNINNDYTFEDFDLHTEEIKSIDSKLALATPECNTEKKVQLQNENNGYKTFELHDQELTDALRAAGLPTAFSSRKHRNSNKKNICETYNKKFIQYSQATCEDTVNHKHSFRNAFVNEHLSALILNEPNTSHYFQNKNDQNCFSHTSQNKYDYEHIINPIQGSDDDDDDDVIPRDNVINNTSQYQRSRKPEYIQDPVKHNNSNTTLFGWTTKYGKQDDTHKLNSSSKSNCSKETSDDELKSESFDEPLLSPEYVNWYKKLKYSTLQVQLAVYVDELSKF